MKFSCHGNDSPIFFPHFVLPRAFNLRELFFHVCIDEFFSHFYMNIACILGHIIFLDRVPFFNESLMSSLVQHNLIEILCQI